ncbi:MAG TPA: isoprenylcysteine carboxylmethyltransferase family protein [Bryobacteraceae bacterium]|nr:isoprenylcysteine carboxylmethyltransferase family protein [Bryobacteraceae bacterium]
MMRLEGRLVSRRVGTLLHALGQISVHAGLPWLVSLRGTRHGWLAGSPSAYNIAGCLPVVIGFLVILCCLIVHFEAAPHGWRIEKTPHYPTPAHLVTTGPYRFSRNPIYLAEAAIWLGWVVFYGSLLVLGFFSLGVLFGPNILKREEHGLEARFGESWRAYTRRTPRWLSWKWS